mmetsp:Transcript_11705/g.19028  ORF Transcript_11705/g.19028 Transcript_11705/m.19028 type:complete len:289 (+) Transcript_11705:52-918(+)
MVSQKFHSRADYAYGASLARGTSGPPATFSDLISFPPNIASLAPVALPEPLTAEEIAVRAESRRAAQHLPVDDRKTKKRDPRSMKTCIYRFLSSGPKSKEAIQSHVATSQRRSGLDAAGVSFIFGCNNLKLTFNALMDHTMQTVHEQFFQPDPDLPEDTAPTDEDREFQHYMEDHPYTDVFRGLQPPSPVIRSPPANWVSHPSLVWNSPASSSEESASNMESTTNMESKQRWRAEDSIVRPVKEEWPSNTILVTTGTSISDRSSSASPVVIVDIPETQDQTTQVNGFK